jgi:hypothetical protein
MGRRSWWSWRPGSDGSERRRPPGPSVRRWNGKWRAAALWGTMSAALLLKLALHLGGAVVFDSDEAIVGLMARHILQGARPVFFYGQAYMGSLDAWLVAGVFALFGPSVGAIRAVQGVLFLAHVGLTYLLARRWSGDEVVASLSALLMAWPPVLLTLYTSVSLGGYVETLVLGDLLLLLGWKLATERKRVWAGGPCWARWRGWAFGRWL